MGKYEMDSSGSGQRPVVSSCEHSNKSSDFIKKEGIY